MKILLYFEKESIVSSAGIGDQQNASRKLKIEVETGIT